MSSFYERFSHSEPGGRNISDERMMNRKIERRKVRHYRRPDKSVEIFRKRTSKLLINIFYICDLTLSS